MRGGQGDGVMGGRAALGTITTRTTVRVSQPPAGARWCRGECPAAGSSEPDEQQIWNRRDYVIGTAGWIRTTDLLIHSLCQVIDFAMVCGKSLPNTMRVSGPSRPNSLHKWHARSAGASKRLIGIEDIAEHAQHTDINTTRRHYIVPSIETSRRVVKQRTSAGEGRQPKGRGNGIANRITGSAKCLVQLGGFEPPTS